MLRHSLGGKVIFFGAYRGFRHELSALFVCLSCSFIACNISTMVHFPFYCNDTQLTLYQLNKTVNLSKKIDKFTVFDLKQ